MSTYKKNKINKGLIVLSKGERRAVISLLSLICLLLGFSLFRPALPFTRKDRMAFHHLDSMLAVHSLEAPSRQAQDPKSQAHPTPASYHTDARPDRYGTEGALPSAPLGNASARPPYGSGGADSREAGASTKPIANEYRKATPHPLQLNTADSTELIVLPQIGEVMASRIHRYRDRLGGYVSLDQLFEVKGMDSARFETIRPYLLLDQEAVRRLDVNHDAFKTLLRHPYLEYEQVKAIVNHRERKGFIRDWKQLCDITGDVNPRLQSYVTY